MKFLIFLGILTLTTLIRSEAENDVIRLSKLWGLEERQGHAENGPYKECVKEFKECVAKGADLPDEQTCRKEFCKCRKNMCDEYFESCKSNSWCSIKNICSKSFTACRFEPKKESKCRRSLTGCLKKSLIGKRKTNDCMNTFYTCLSE